MSLPERMISPGSNSEEPKPSLRKQRQARDHDELIPRALRGDAEALEILFARHNHMLYQTALRLLGNREDAEDALQEGLLAAYRNLPRFEGRSQFSTWLTRIVINAALMRLRSQRSRPSVSLEEALTEDQTPLAERYADTAPDPEQFYAGKQLSEVLEDNLEELSPLLRSAFRLREVEGLTTGEAARTLGISENTLKARLWRARQQLAARVGRRLRRGKTPEAPRASYGLGDFGYACCD